MMTLQIFALVLTLSLVACHPRPVVLIVPGPLRHDIGLWPDSDLICVAPPTFQQLYVRRRCVPMRTIRTLILQTRFALDVP